MKILFLFLILITNVFASEVEWQKRLWGAREIVDLYPNHESFQLIEKPEGAVQAMMGLVLFNNKLEVYKECLAYEIPLRGEMGSVFLTTTSALTPCEEVIAIGKREHILNVRSLSFSLNDSNLILRFSDDKFRSRDISISLPLLKKNKKPEKLQSLVQRKWGRSLIVLQSNREESFKQPALLGKFEDVWGSNTLSLCENVSEDCERSVSQCDQCRFGYFEIPNGCVQGGPKYCGVDQCGMKGMPACKRGFLYQNQTQEKMDCRTDASFAFCKKGLRVRCQGNLAICD